MTRIALTALRIRGTTLGDHPNPALASDDGFAGSPLMTSLSKGANVPVEAASVRRAVLDRVLAEFPNWVTAAPSGGILR